MKAFRITLRACLSVCLASILSLDIALLLYRQYLSNRAATLTTGQIWLPRAQAIPSGYLANGLAYGPSVTSAGCFALLYTSANCGYCAAEMPAWRELVRRANGLGCDALRIATYRGAESPGETEQSEGRQVVFLEPGWLEGSPPRSIPTLMIFARGASPATCFVGEMGPAADKAALLALNKAAVFSATRAALRNDGKSAKPVRLTCR